MPDESQRPESPSRRERRFLLGLVAVLAFGAFLIVRPYAGWIVFALFLGFILFPLRQWLVDHRVPRWLAAGIGTLLGAGIVIGPLAYIMWQLSDELGGLATAIGERGPDFFVARILRAVGVPQSARESILGFAEGALATAAQQAVNLVSNITVGSVLAVFLLFAVLADGDRLVAWMRKNVPLSEGRREVLFAEATRGLNAITFGVIAVAIVQGITAALGWWLFGLPEPGFWGFVLVVASLIPYVGVYIVLFPAAAWLATTGAVTKAVLFALFAMFIVGTVDNVVRPILIGRKGGIHPAIVLVGVIGGVPAFGAMGIVVGPLVLALLLAVLEVVRRPERAEREGKEILDGNASTE